MANIFIAFYFLELHSSKFRALGSWCSPHFYSLNRRDEICALLGCFAACCGKSLPTFRDNLWGPIFSILDLLALKMILIRLSRNVGKDLPLHTAKKTQKSADIICVAAEAWNHEEYSRVSNNKFNTYSYATQDLEVKGHNWWHWLTTRVNGA